MKIAQIVIENFRGIKHACLNFDGHVLLLGMNNVGKSTVCEAIDLVLGPDRLSGPTAIQEFDFYNSDYLGADAAVPVKIEITVTLISLSDEAANRCAAHLAHWHVGDRRVLDEGEIDLVDADDVCECLRLKTTAIYNAEDDDFEAKTVFVDGPAKSDGETAEVPKNIKRLFGFLYLRTLRTGSRALSLERGSLLDLILRQRGVQAGIWEDAIKRMRELDPLFLRGKHTESMLDGA